MKKILALTLAITISGTVYASGTSITNALHHKKSVTYFKLTAANQTLGYMNLFSVKPVKARILVNEFYGFDDKKADRVLLTCNDKETYIKPGKWVDCKIKQGSSANVQINAENFHVGADGVYELKD